MHNQVQPTLTPRIEAAVKADAAEEIQRLLIARLFAKQKEEAERKAAAEAADLQIRLVQGKMQDLLIEREARKHLPPDMAPAKSFGDWLAAVLLRSSPHLEKAYGSVLSIPDRNHWPRGQKAAMGESSGATGGYTVPTEFAQDIMAVPAASGFIRQRAQIVTMTSGALQYPLLDVTTAQAAGTSPFSGGLLMSWLAEGAARTETEPAFKQLELKAWELSGALTISNPLRQDGVNMEGYLKTVIGSAVGEYEEAAFLTGNGVGKPQGILGAAATIPITRQTASIITFLDASTMLSTLPPNSLEYACWVCSPTALQQLLELKDAITGERAIVMHAGLGDTPSRPLMTLAGLRVQVSQWLPALGTKGDLMLIDPRYYVIGDRGLFIASSDQVDYLKFQIVVRVVDRVDGQPWLNGPITLQDGVTQVSPFVVLN